MDNAAYGIQASGRSFVLFLSSLAQYQLFWGFLLGFVVASIIYAFIVTENPAHMAAMIFYDKGESFEKLYPKPANGNYKVSYSTHSHTVDKVKIIFGLFGTMIMLAMIIALFRF